MKLQNKLFSKVHSMEHLARKTYNKIDFYLKHVS